MSVTYSPEVVIVKGNWLSLVLIVALGLTLSVTIDQGTSADADGVTLTMALDLDVTGNTAVNLPSPHIEVLGPRDPCAVAIPNVRTLTRMASTKS